MGMDEQEFRRLLDLFPVVRPRDFHLESELSRQSSSQSKQSKEEWEDAWGEVSGKEVMIQGTEQHDAFWEKLKLAAERKVGVAEAEQFCKAFQQIHSKLVHKDLSLESARKFVNASNISV